MEALQGKSTSTTSDDAPVELADFTGEIYASPASLKIVKLLTFSRIVFATSQVSRSTQFLRATV